jgi:hypothetical protein
MKLRRLISLLLVLCILAPARVYANDEQIPPIQQPAGETDPGNVLTVVKKSNLVPFTGILLSPRAVAEMLSKLELAKKEAELAAARAQEQQRIKDEAEIKVLLVQVDAEKKSTDERLAIRDNRIANLEKDLAKSQTDKPNPVTWALVGAGTTAMIIATLATVILVGNSSK